MANFISSSPSGYVNGYYQEAEVVEEIDAPICIVKSIFIPSMGFSVFNDGVVYKVNREFNESGDNDIEGKVRIPFALARKVKTLVEKDGEFTKIDLLIARQLFESIE